MKSAFYLLKVNFMGKSPSWYKLTIIAFLTINPLLFYFVNPFVAGWAILIQFIFTLACALICYPLQPGGLLALEAIFIGLTNTDTVFNEVVANIPTLLLLIFMVAAIYYLKDILFILITKLFLTIKKKYFLALVFCVICASLSAFLDALTLVAISIAVCFNFYAIYHRVLSNSKENEEEFEEFRGFLRNIIMHGVVGTIIGGTMTIVGEPQNIMIGTKMGWSFSEFFAHNSVISLPAGIAGVITCFLLEYFRFPGFRYQMPEKARELITKDYRHKIREITKQTAFLYTLQIIVFILLVFALGFHVAEVGLIGIGLIVIVTAFTGRTKEHDLAEAFNNAMPFATLIIVFFAILAVVHDQHLVAPLTQWVFTLSGKTQLMALYFVNGTLSFTSDNVFIASIFIGEVDRAYAAGTFSREWYEKLGVIVNMGTNIPAIATPNGHAALLFLLTSSLAPMIKLSYFRMFKLTLPYTIVMTGAGAVAVYLFF
ncbi:MAG: sodium/proton antiporter [Deferribacteraceae bacterium]|jgi:NhaB family Na+:H+ antiporter|nr:sodium/proton antiporter [Deferribacteraceae bacterium]